jgi:hypothetical protein
MWDAVGSVITRFAGQRALDDTITQERGVSSMEDGARKLAKVVSQIENARVFAALTQAADRERGVQALFDELLRGFTAELADCLRKLGPSPSEARVDLAHSLWVSLAIIINLATGRPDAEPRAGFRPRVSSSLRKRMTVRVSWQFRNSGSPTFYCHKQKSALSCSTMRNLGPTTAAPPGARWKGVFGPVSYNPDGEWRQGEFFYFFGRNPFENARFYQRNPSKSKDFCLDLFGFACRELARGLYPRAQGRRLSSRAAPTSPPPR